MNGVNSLDAPLFYAVMTQLTYMPSVAVVKVVGFWA
jgi:hypothetical protein